MQHLTANGELFQKLSGSQLFTAWGVETSKPAALFSGSTCTFVSDGSGACDILYEQMFPEAALAAEYVACPTLTQPINCSGSACAHDLFQIIATEDSTTSVEFSPNVTENIILMTWPPIAEMGHAVLRDGGRWRCTQKPPMENHEN